MKRHVLTRAELPPRRDGQGGAALVLALLATALILSLGLIFIELATSQLRLAGSRRDAALALNAAEAGLHLALDRLARGEEVPPAGTGRMVLNPDVSYEVSALAEAKDKKDEIFTVTANGYAGRAHRRVSAQVAVRLESQGQEKDKEPPGQAPRSYSVEVLSWREGF